MRLTRANIEKKIKDSTGYDVVIVKGDGYYWFASDDQETGLMLASLESTSVYINSLGQYSMDNWIHAFKNILKG